jgi:transposase
MQSTGVYWIAVYDILEAADLEVYLVNARETKNLPGRKSDVQQSQWLMKVAHLWTVAKFVQQYAIAKLNPQLRSIRALPSTRGEGGWSIFLVASIMEV